MTRSIASSFTFDTTTQEDVHGNSIHVTSETGCLPAAVDELPGGFADEYAQHICDTLDSLCETYVYFNDASVSN